MKRDLLFLLLLFSSGVNAQLTETFTDGNYTSNPVWTGTSATFAVNPSMELQTTGTLAGASYLSTPHGLSTLDNQEWRVRVKMTFSPSTSNYSRVFLTSTTDLSTNGDGFFLQFGESGSTDAVRLKKLVGGIETEICAGTTGEIANSFNISVRVLRDNAGNWSLYTDPTGGTNYAFQATGTDAASIIGTYFGVSAIYTASNASKFYYDDIYAGPEIVDTQAPSLVSATPLTATTVDVLFDEPVSGSTVTVAANYSLNPAITVSSAVQDGTNGALVHLTLSAPMTNGEAYDLTVGSMEDAAGNIATALTAGFTYLVSEQAEKGDVIISEFICDPSPAIGLPELEFIEIYNSSSKYFDLSGWKLGDASADGTITGGWIGPGEYKILCAASSQAAFPGSYAVTSFPSLNNASDDIVLKDASLLLIDKLSYTDDWYHDAIKAEGGYSIELINPNDPCPDASNWTASNATAGGTPGAQNSVYDTTPDTQAPSLTSATAISSTSVELHFSEGMDSVSLVNASFQTTPSLGAAMITASSAFTEVIYADFASGMTPSTVYTFTYGPVADCWLNAITITGNFALADEAEPGDIVINEILFDPATGGSDFIELYNRSSKIINLKNYALANYDDGLIANVQTIPTDHLLYPDDYVVLTSTADYHINQFPQAVAANFYQLTTPSYNNDSSTVILLNSLSAVLDMVSYTADWHLSVIDETENKTLERIDPAGTSNSASNWHTAAENIGFGTPGRKNSQYQAGGSSGDFGTSEPIFSPDNDGFQDVLLFNYTMQQGEMIASVIIFDDHGRIIRKLMQSEVLGASGTFSWDGVNASGLKSQPGVYLAVMEAFSADGKANFSKRIAFTLAGKLN